MRDSWFWINVGVALLSLSCGRVAYAQQKNPAIESSKSVWLAYVGEHPISQRWDLHLETQVFWYGAAERTELIFLRPGLRREFSHGISVLTTYAYFLKYPAITNASTTLSEHRISEDFQWKHPLLSEGTKRLTLTHRLRAEQRFQARDNRNGHNERWQYAERFRYRLTANIPLPGNTSGVRPDYVSLYNEVFVNFGPHSEKHALDQNIAAGAVGWNLTPTLQFEVGYLLEYVPSPAGVVGVYNHVVQINLFSDFPFSKRKAPG
jgi:Protein of unknown function (DUF2490)